MVEHQVRVVETNGQGQFSSSKGNSFDDFKKLGPFYFFYDFDDFKILGLNIEENLCWENWF